MVTGARNEGQPVNIKRQGGGAGAGVTLTECLSDCFTDCALCVFLNVVSMILFSLFVCYTCYDCSLTGHHVNNKLFLIDEHADEHAEAGRGEGAGRAK